MRQPRSLRLAAVAAVGAVLIVSGVLAVRDGPDPRPLPLTVGGSRAVEPAGDAAPVEGGVRFVAAPALAPLDGDLPAHRLAPPSEAAVRTLARALHLDVPTRRPEGWGVVDGARSLDVSEAAGAWWYSSTSDGSVSSGAVSPDGSPAAVPASAERAARALAGAADLALDDARVTVAGGQPSVVTFSPAVDDIPIIGASTSIAVSSDGTVVSASGLLATPERTERLDLIGTRVAIDRLNRGVALALAGGSGLSVERPMSPSTPFDPDGTGQEPPGSSTGVVSRSSGGGGISPSGTTGSEPPTTLIAPCADLPADADRPRCAVPGPPASPPTVPPCDGTGAPTTFPCNGPRPAVEPPVPSRQPVEITVTSASLVLVAVPGRTPGTAWLVPGYRLQAADGTQTVTLAVADDAVDLGPAPALRSLPALPGPPETPCASVGDSGEGVAADDAPGGTDVSLVTTVPASRPVCRAAPEVRPSTSRPEGPTGVGSPAHVRRADRPVRGDLQEPTEPRSPG